MTAALHRDFLQIGVTNRLVRPGGVRCSGRRSRPAPRWTATPTWWPGSPTTCAPAELLPVYPAAFRPQAVRTLDQRTYCRNGQPARQREGQVPGGQGLAGRPAGMLRHAENCHGSWWPDCASWLAERCGEEVAAPGELGGVGLEPIGDAPGTYVYDR